MEGEALIQAVIEAARLVAGEIEADHPHIRDADPVWFRPGTQELVLALDALDFHETFWTEFPGRGKERLPVIENCAICGHSINWHENGQTMCLHSKGIGLERCRCMFFRARSSRETGS